MVLPEQPLPVVLQPALKDGMWAATESVAWLSAPQAPVEPATMRILFESHASTLVRSTVSIIFSMPGHQA